MELIAIVIAFHLQLLAAADESEALREAGDIIMSSFGADPARLNFELLFLCKSIVNSKETCESWDDVAERVISRVKSTVQGQEIPEDEAHRQHLDFDSVDTINSDKFNLENEWSQNARIQNAPETTQNRQRISMTDSKHRFGPKQAQAGWITRAYAVFRALGVSEQSGTNPKIKTSTPNPELVKQLVTSGFSRHEAESALLRANDDIVSALAELTRPKAVSVDSQLAAQLAELGFPAHQVFHVRRAE